MKKKEEYYPTLAKNALFKSSYLIPQSAHSRASTVDLTIIDSQTLVELDMGTCFDFFDPLSWIDSADISFQQRAIGCYYNMALFSLIPNGGILL